MHRLAGRRLLYVALNLAAGGSPVVLDYSHLALDARLNLAHICKTKSDSRVES